MRWIALITLVISAGCSNGPVVPVSGTVAFEGRELPEVCRLTFVPTEVPEGEQLRPNGATMHADGSYEMTPHLGVKGLLPGKYVVRVAYYDLRPGGNPDREGDWRERTYEAEPLEIQPGESKVEYDIVVPKK